MPQEIHTYTHTNGFRHVYQRIRTTEPTVYIYLYCNVGSAMEPPNLRGVSHFVEHMCFKGTPSHPKARDFLHIFDSTGCYFNGYTSKRSTLYYIKCHANDLAHLLFALSDGVLNSVFVPGEYKKELKVVTEEMIRAMDNNNLKAKTYSDQMVYAGTPFERPVDSYDYHTDPDSDLASRKKVIEFYKKWYCPQNMILSVSGNLSYKDFVHTLGQSHFLRGSRIEGNLSLSNLYIRPIPSTGPEYNITSLDIPKTSYVSISFRTCDYNSTDKYVLDFLSELFSSYFSSKLTSMLRQENGLTYTSQTTTAYYECGGDFTIFAVSDVDKLVSTPGVIPIIISLLNETKAKGVTTNELRLTKMYLQRSRELGIMTDECAAHNGEWLLMHPNGEDIIPYQNVYDDFFANITSAQIKRVAQKYFVAENMTVCVMGKGVNKASIIRACSKI